jgi:hypothetical protein
VLVAPALGEEGLVHGDDATAAGGGAACGEGKAHLARGARDVAATGCPI